jgi:type 2 lantibiotic biosynthesis protein LanM
MQRWASQRPFDAGSYFNQRLALDGTDENELEYLLGEAGQNVRDRLESPPAWLTQLTDAFARARPNARASLSGGPSNHSVGGFLKVVEPLIEQGLRRLNEGINQIGSRTPDLPFDPGSVARLFTPDLFRSLILMLSRTMILELNVARLQGHLQGETAEARFQCFVERLGNREIAFALLEEYPVLARQLTTRINNWVDFTLEFLGHLCADRDFIKSRFSSNGELGLLSDVTGGAGDSHRGGRAVMIARFDTGLQVVYKPRSLAIDAHFQDLLSWLNERGDHAPFRTLGLLDRESHGWMEFVPAKECASEEEVRRFYERQGGFLALLYVIEAVDFHYENLIASGEHPVLIDLESLFHPRPAGGDETDSLHLAQALLDRSVLRTSLLPRRIWLGEAGDGIDVSGMGAVGGQLSPYSGINWEKTGTDEMHVVRKQGKMPGGQNRPSFNGAEINLLDYGDAIIAGFTSVYRTIVNHRDGLLSEGGPLAKFAGDEVRVLLRPTRTYSELLSESLHPDLLRTALDRDRFFDRLWIETEKHPHLTRVIRAERDDLHAGDVPMFTSRAGSRDVWTGSGERIESFFDETGLGLVRRRVESLGDEDLARQLWFIRASLTSLAMGSEQTGAAPYTASEAIDAPDREQLLQAARAIGDRLETLAIRGRDDAAWIGLSLINERRWSLVPLGLDLYAGLPGVALFLAYLGEVAAEERYTALAQAALATVRRELEKSKTFYKSVGGFTGLGGIIYTLTHLGSLFDRRSLIDEAEELIELLPPLFEQDETLDVIGGAAGCIASLLSFYDCRSSGRAFGIAVECGDGLIAKAARMESGIAWRTRIAKGAPLTGFSHGAAGMAWSLLRLADASGEGRFRDAALEAIAYERSLFSSEAGNWPDLRDAETLGSGATEGQASYSTAWCHGAPGIGLSRLYLLSRADDEQARTELNAALRTTLALGFGQNHSLCHGDLGNLDLVLQAAEALDDPFLRSEAVRAGSRVFHSIAEHGWLCGVPMRVETPGLMVGLAGIGYGLLRMADPARVPSVLTLAPPYEDGRDLQD